MERRRKGGGREDEEGERRARERGRKRGLKITVGDEVRRSA